MDNNKVLAKVGHREITQEDVSFLIKNLNPQSSGKFQSEEGQKQLLEELINQELFYLDGLDKNLDQDDFYLEELEKLKSTLLKQYAISKLLGNLKVSEKEVEDFYSKNQSNFITPKSIRASHILVNDKEKAEEIIQEINDGLAFEEAARKYSSCPSKERGGDLGFFSRGQMVPEFENYAFNTELHTLSPPIKTQFGYHIILVTNEAAERTMTTDEARPQIERQLLAEKQQNVYLENVERLKKIYKVERY